LVGGGTVAVAAPVPVALYDAIGNPPGNVSSLGFEATSTKEFGDRVQVGPGPRGLSSVTVLMSSWACVTGSWNVVGSCATTPGATFTHPLTMTLYADNGTGTPGGVLTSMTMTATIPYRPSANSVNCDGKRWYDGTTCYSGLAAPVTFNFPVGTVLPSRFIWAISYNTTNRGYNPIGPAACGTNCPYDSLNVGASSLTPNPSKGTDVEPSGVFVNTSTAANYCDGGAGGVDVLRLANGCWPNLRPMATIKTLALSESSSTVVVRASTPTWGFFTENTVGAQTGSYGAGPSAPPMGTGSAEFGLSASTQGMALGTLSYAGTPLRNLTELGYSSYQTGTPQAVSLQFDINYHAGDVDFAGRLVYEPYLTGTVTPNSWQSWNALDGKWWASKTNTPGSDGLCGQGSPCTWAQVMTNWPTATIRNTVLFKAGSGWSSFSGAVDALSIGVDDGLGNVSRTTFDFEPTPQCTTVCYVDAVSGNDVNGGTSAVDAKKTIQAGVNQVSIGGVVHVAAGSYAEDVAVNKPVTLQGAGAALTTVVGQSGGSHATLYVTAVDVMIDGFTITRAGNALATWNDPLNTAGVSVNGSGRAEIRNNTFTGNRTAIDINNSTGNVVRNNVIDDNRTGMILWNTTDNTVVTENAITNNWTLGVLLIDGSGGTNVPAQQSVGSSFTNNDISGNWYGGIVDRHAAGSLPAPGSNLKDFSGNWFGTTAPVVSSANSAEPGYASLIPVEFGGSAVPPVGTPDVLGAGAANIDITPFLDSGVDTSAAHGFQGSHAAVAVSALGAQTGSTSRLQEGVDLVDAGGVVRATAGDFSTIVPVQIAKSLSLVGPNVGVSPTATRVAEATVTSSGGVGIRIAAPNVQVDGLFLTCSAGCFVLDASSANVVIRNNDVSVDVGGAVALTPAWSGGSVSVNHNTLHGVNESVVAVGSASANLANVAINRNAIVGLGVRNDINPAALDATCNWWGSAAGAAATQHIGNVTVSPSLHTPDLDGSCVDPVVPVDQVGPSVDPVVPARLADFVPVQPSRVFDTRPDAPPSLRVVDKVKIGGEIILEVKVTDLGDLVPASGVGSVSLNVTAVDPDGAGFVTAWPCGQMPLASNLNYLAGQTVPNAVIAPVSATGTVCFYSLRPAHLVVDINGWFRAGGGYTPVGPRRVLDTRPDQHTETLRSVPTSKLPTGTEMEVQLADLGSYVPPSGVAAVSLNVTVVDAEQPGYLSVYPCGQRPLVSSVNYEVGATVANEVIAVLSSTGKVCFFANSTIDLVVDVNGWLASVSDFNRSGPARVVDTRPGENVHALLQVTPAPIEPGRVLEVNVADLGELVPTTGISAVSLNVTATNVSAAGYITVFPCGQVPLVSSVNYATPQLSTANAVLVPVSAAGTVCFFSLRPVDLVVDINGWFAAI
jgi:parallel beta-helix repeat protein